MNQYLCKLLEQDHNNFNPRADYRWPEFGIDLSAGEMGLRMSKMMHKQQNNLESLKEASKYILPHLVQEGVFTRDEVTNDNYLAITKAYIQMQISYNKLIDNREKGDFLTEESVFNAASSYSQPISHPDQPITTTKAAEPPRLYSALLDKYTTEKLTAGIWQQHTAPDHLNRLKSFIEIIGDRPINDISRDDMRQFRDILRQLPPNRARSAQYKGKTIAEILAMKPKSTLNVKTVNVTIEAVASFLDWCLKENYLVVNPGKGYNLKILVKTLN